MEMMTKKEFRYEFDKLKEQIVEKTAENTSFREKQDAVVAKNWDVENWEGEGADPVVKSLHGVPHKNAAEAIVKKASPEGAGSGFAGTPALTSFVTPSSQMYSRVFQQDMPNFFCDMIPLLSEKKPEVKLWDRNINTYYDEDMGEQSQAGSVNYEYLRKGSKTIRTAKYETGVIVEDEELDAEAGEGLEDSNQVASEKLAIKFKLKKERLATDVILADSSYDATNRASVDWSKDAMNTEDAVQRVWSANTFVGKTGFRFNQAIMAQDVVDSLLVSDEIRALMSSNVSPDRPLTEMDLDRLAALMKVNRIHVAGAVSTKGSRNIDPDDDTVADSDYMVKGKALFYYAPMTLTRNSITAVNQFGWNRPSFNRAGERIKMIRDEEHDQWKWKGTMHKSYHVDTKELAFLFTVTV